MCVKGVRYNGEDEGKVERRRGVRVRVRVEVEVGTSKG